MVRLIEQLDCITFRADCCGRVLIVWEFESSFAMYLHLMERKLQDEVEIVYPEALCLD